MTTRESSIDCLPLELLSDVFVRLPVKTLLQIRSVCKTWNSIISCPSFSQLYLRQPRAKNDQSTKYLLACERRPRPSYPTAINVRCSETLDVVEELKMWNFEVKIHNIVSYVDGILFIRRSIRELDNDNLAIFLLNPTIGNIVRIPLNEVLDRSKNVNFGFGFDPMSKDYKVVRFNSRNMASGTRVFNLSSNSWNLAKEAKCSINGYVRLSKMSHTINFDGGIYWSCRITTNRKKSDYFVRFDLSSEEFTSIKLPDFKLPVLNGSLALNERRHCRRPSVLNDSLALVDVVSDVYYCHEHIRVWSRVKDVSNEVDCWVELYKLDFNKTSFVLLKSNGDMYLRDMRWTKRGKIVVCNLESIEEKRLLENEASGIIFLDSYTPSLVLLGHPIVSLNGNNEAKETS